MKRSNIRIIKYIPFGKENAVSRQYLCDKTGLDDRAMRDLINKERKRSVIINLQNGKGYYRPTKKDIEEVERYKKQEEKRAKNIFSNLAPVRRFLRNIDL